MYKILYFLFNFNFRFIFYFVRLQKKVDPHGKVLKLIEAFSHIRSPDSFFDHWWTQLWKTTKQSNMLGELIAVEEQLRQAIAPRGELFTANRFLRLFTECIGKHYTNKIVFFSF